MTADQSLPAWWCGDCDRRTRLAADGRRCARCNPLADRDADPDRRPWCGRCDQRDRMVRDEAGARKCRACHPLGRPPQQWPMHDVPDGYTEQLLACEWLCHISPTLRRIGSDRLRVLLQLWFEAGWTPRDVLYGLDSLPTGEPQIGEVPTAASDPKVTEAYVKRRLRAWLDDDNHPIPAINQQVTANRTKALAAQLAARQDWQRRERLAVPPSRARGAAQARLIASQAAARSLRRRRSADERERAQRTADLATGHEAAERWKELLSGGRPAEPPLPRPRTRPAPDSATS
ncbi:hypothetical protein [Phytohabitans rumicis]|uniref:Uncharacterized protein n=1 Tax=Phytohabitans rumicis TaxID=1076125 RepID=A0A6V8LNN4_9ACTN|nr:hypothetical protein [Phytohabitans rumicis]GFJ95806.1 hypothetical protein Prum_094480 [Phytohabitans rumicis]